MQQRIVSVHQNKKLADYGACGAEYDVSAALD